MDAVIVAGGAKCAADDVLCPSQYRALLPLCGRPMICYITEAIYASGCIDKIYIVGNKNVFEPIYQNISYVEILPEGKNLVDNVCRGLQKTEGFTLFGTVDIPLITGQVVREFIEQCLRTTQYRIFYPVVEQSVNEKAYPTTKRTYFRMKEGKFTGGNLMILHTEMLATHREKFEELIMHRKSAVKMAFDIGLVTVIKMLIGRLSLEEAEQRCCKVLNIKGKALVSYAPEICLDVDKVSDYETATAALKQTATA